jgi:hypothetical protein
MANLHTFIDNSPSNAASSTYADSREQYGILDNTAGPDGYAAKQDRPPHSCTFDPATLRHDGIGDNSRKTVGPREQLRRRRPIRCGPDWPAGVGRIYA